MITKDEPIKWSDPEKKVPEEQESCSVCLEDGCASIICYGICDHVSI